MEEQQNQDKAIIEKQAKTDGVRDLAARTLAREEEAPKISKQKQHAERQAAREQTRQEIKK